MTQTDLIEPTPMSPIEKDDLIAAAKLVVSQNPGALGELGSRELTAAADFGYRLGPHSLLRRLVAEAFAERDRRLGEAS